MDAVKFLLTLKRICKSCPACIGCPLCESDDRNCMLDKPIELYDAPFETLVKKVIEWEEKHPIKTRLVDFMEKHPNARLVEGLGIPYMTPHDLGYCSAVDCKGCEQNRYTPFHCWNMPLEG